MTRLRARPTLRFLASAAVLVALLFMVLALLIIFAHFYVAIQVYLVTLEFHLIATFAVLLLPPLFFRRRRV